MNGKLCKQVYFSTLVYKSNFAATVGRLYCRYTDTESDIDLNVRN